MDFAGDLDPLATHLGFDKYSMVGYSSGGAYTLACAYCNPDKIHKCGLVGSIKPKDHKPSILKRMGERKLPIRNYNDLLGYQRFN